jgi:hypothetical protein
VNVVTTYLTAHRERLGLDRLGVPARPTCLLLTPRFRLSRHVIALVLGGRGQQPVLVAKLPRLAGDGGALAREATALRAAERALNDGDAGTAPRLIAFDEHVPHPLLLETAIGGRPLSPAAVRRDRDGAVADVAAWLERLALATARRARDDEWHERLVAAPLRALAAGAGAGSEVSTMAERTLELAAPLRSARPPLVLVHGDLAHPNLLRQGDGRLGVLDWERGELSGLPAYDLFFFLAYVAMAAPDEEGDGGRLAGVRAAFFGERAWAWPVVERYADAIGLERALLPTLLAICSARAVAATGAPSPLGRQVSARDATARHMLLWRHALDGSAAPRAVLSGGEGA